MKKILLVCALEREMNDLKHYYKEHKGTLSFEVEFLLLGYGRSNVVKNLVKFLPENKYDLLFNVGTCGIKIKGEQKKCSIGSLIEPCVVFDGDFCLENEVRNIPLNKTVDGIPLVTISSFGRYDAYMNTSYIEDMEGYEIANICNALNQPFKIIKIISNHITNNPDRDLAEFYENCVKVMTLNTINIFRKLSSYI